MIKKAGRQSKTASGARQLQATTGETQGKPKEESCQPEKTDVPTSPSTH
jgi:hypothetical protein